MRIRLLTLLTALLAYAVGGPTQAANLLVNGDFETFSINHSSIFGNGSNGLPTLAGWSTTGYNFVFTDSPTYTAFGNPGQSLTGADNYFDGAYATASGASGSRFWLWGPDMLTASNGLTNSPTGGSFVGADGAYLNRPIEQVVTGLEVGREYSVGFWWAAAQQYNYHGVTTEAWKVCFGVCTYTNTNVPDSYAIYDNIAGSQFAQTASVTNANHGFVPWQYSYFTFTAQSTTQTLSLLAYGTPLGQPPFSLIDGVQLNAVPEPTTWAMMLIGFGVIGGVMRTRRQSRHGPRALNAQII